MHISVSAAAWFAPLVLPVCLWIAWYDLRHMKIPNRAVAVMVVIFVIVGPVVLPLDVFAWRLLHLVVVLAVGLALRAGGLLGAGDVKFAAAAAPFIAPGDLQLVLMILAGTMLAGYAAHRLAKHTALRRLAPHWQSWTREKKYPMGLSLGGAMAAYLVLGALHGA